MRKIMVLTLTVMLVLSFTLASCGTADRETEIAVIVALTQTAAALQQPEVEPLPTETPIASATTEAPSDTPLPPIVELRGFQPFPSESCAAMNEAIAASIGLSGSSDSPVYYSDLLTGEVGTACQLIYSATADVYSGEMFEPARATFTGQGWTEDINYGAGGAGSVQTAFRKDASLCIVSFSFKPIDSALCDPTEFYPACMERLSPEQKIYNLTLTCTTYFP